MRKIIHSLKPVDCLHVHAGNPWYNYYLYDKGSAANFGLSLYLCPHPRCALRDRSGEAVRLRKHVWAFAARLCDK